MKNLLLTFAFGILSFTIVNAQTNFGIKSSIGYMNSKSSTSYVTSASDYVAYEIDYSGNSPVISIGGFAQTKIGYLWVSSEVLYTHYNVKYNVKSYLPHNRFNDTKEINESNTYIDVPVVAGVHSNNFRIGVGPVLHFLAKLDSDFNQFEFYNEKTKSLTFGFLGTIGYDFEHIHIDLSYENIFRGLGYHINYGYKSARFKGSPGQIKLAVGYSF